MSLAALRRFGTHGLHESDERGSVDDETTRETSALLGGAGTVAAPP